MAEVKTSAVGAEIHEDVKDLLQILRTNKNVRSAFLDKGVLKVFGGEAKDGIFPSIACLQGDAWTKAAPHLKNVIVTSFYVDSIPHVMWFVASKIKLKLSACHVWTHLQGELNDLVKTSAGVLEIEGETWIHTPFTQE